MGTIVEMRGFFVQQDIAPVYGSTQRWSFYSAAVQIRTKANPRTNGAFSLWDNYRNQ